MQITVFYAWQSDRPKELNHYFVRDAAKAACERITADNSNAWAVALDSDTRGVVGMCDIPNTILEKINACDIFLADLTLVGSTDDSDNKPLPNPNVVFELGYAAKSHGFDVLIGVMNEAFGTVDGQVFDIKRRASLLYKASVTDSAEFRKAQRDELSRALEGVFRATIDAVVSVRRRLPVEVSASFSHNVKKEESIIFTVKNTGPESLPPYKMSIFHPKLGSYFMFS
jgi:hypothetical protein